MLLFNLNDRTIDPRCTATSVIRPSRNCGHSREVQRYFHNTKLQDISFANNVTTLIGSRLLYLDGDLSSEIRLYCGIGQNTLFVVLVFKQPQS